MRLNSKVVSYAAPQRGVIAYEKSYYTKPTGYEKMRVRYLEHRDDIYDDGLRSYSDDNGKTWIASQPFRMSEKTPHGVLRRMESSWFVDPTEQRFLCLLLEGVLQHDTHFDGFKTYYARYRVSTDGGRTALVDDIAVQRGDYNPKHPFEHVWVGKNCIMPGGPGSILRSRKGHLIVGTQFWPLGSDGEQSNPGGGWTWLEILILFGHWQPDGRIEWECGPRIALDPSQSTRGACEPTLAQMPDGRILMVMRGSNGGSKDSNYILPSHKWHSVSSDDARTWSTPQRWDYSDGTPFFSPSSISQLLWHSNGRLYWFGNICPANARGNLPRYPLVAAEVDPTHLAIIKESVFEVDTLQPDDQPTLTLSNFSVHQDRSNGELIVHVTRCFADRDGTPCGDAYVYRLEP